MSKLYIGVDIGGTSIVAARFSDNEMLEKTEVPTGADRPAEQIMESLYVAIEKVLTDEVVGIGIGMPGFMNVDTGRRDLIYPLSRTTTPTASPWAKPITAPGRNTITWWELPWEPDWVEVSFSTGRSIPD